MAGFGVIQSGNVGVSGSVAIAGASAVTIANVTMTNADTEYSYALPAATKTFRIKLRAQNAAFRIYPSTGSSSFITVNAGGSYGESGVSLTGITLFFQSSVASQTAEIISYQ